MEQLIGLIVIGIISGVMWLLNAVGQKAQEKQQQEAAERQRQAAAARQRQRPDEEGRTTVTAEPRKKKYRQIEQLRGQAETLVLAETVSPPPLRRESVFGESYDGTPFDDSTNRATDVAPTARQLSHHENPIADHIMAMMANPQSMQQVVILSEIFNRPKYFVDGNP